MAYPHIFDHALRRYATIDMPRRRPTSGTANRATLCYVVSGISESGMIENVGVAIDISLLSHASPEIQCTSGLNAAFCFLAVGQCR